MTLPAESQSNPLAILDDGVEAWNEWRRAHDNAPVDLSGTDLSERDLTGVNFSSANLSGTDLYGATLTKANLKMANLTKADLSNSDLERADAYKANMTGAFLVKVKFMNADLMHSYLKEADLRGSNLTATKLEGADAINARFGHCTMHGCHFMDSNVTGADFSFADLANANLTGMRYGGYKTMRGHYYGVRGLDTAYGNALFVRDALDQDYLDTFEVDIGRIEHPTKKRIAATLFSAWGLIDYGRSLLKVGIYALIVASVFGIIYALDMYQGWGLMDFSSSAKTWFTPFYYSLVTYTTLGFGDITADSLVGEILIIAEVIIGYFTLGLLLSILANTVARRS